MMLRLALALLLATAAATARAQPAPRPGDRPAQCFYLSRLDGWKAPDARTLLLRVNTRDYWRLELAGECPMLTSPGVHLVTKTRGSDTICRPIDLDLSVAEDGPGGVRVPCLVRSMRMLTAQEVAAIPPKLKP